MTLQQEQTPIDQEIVKELVALTPDTWRRVVLEVDYTSDSQGDGLDHVIYNPDGLRDLVEPSETIYSATFRLQQVFRKYGGCWKKATYKVDVDEDEELRYHVSFVTS